MTTEVNACLPLAHRRRHPIDRNGLALYQSDVASGCKDDFSCLCEVRDANRNAHRVQFNGISNLLSAYELASLVLVLAPGFGSNATPRSVIAGIAPQSLHPRAMLSCSTENAHHPVTNFEVCEHRMHAIMTWTRYDT